MAAIAGSVRVAGVIAPTDSTDTYAVTDDLYQRGGFRPVADITARNAISADRRKSGMLVYVISETKFYTLAGGLLDVNWALATFADLTAIINDAAANTVTDKTYSANKISALISAAQSAAVTSAVDAVTNGASTALDTLAELAAAMGNDASFATTIATALGERVRFDAAQTMPLAKQQQACANIGVGDPEHNFVADYTAAKA